MNPRVSVLMAAYNAAPYVQAAVDSILAQTFAGFELIVVEDGSTDATPAILAECAQRDARVRLLSLPHAGLCTALNRGLALARASLVARMDADDVARPARLAKQVAFMDQHPEVGLCGTWGELLDARSRILWRYAVSDAELRCRQLFETALMHPSVMLRPELVRAVGGYDPDYPTAEDYDLWVRLSEHTQMANLPEPLLLHRRHATQVTRVARADGRGVPVTGRIRLRRLRRLGLEPSAAEMDLHNALGRWHFEPTAEALERTDAWLERIRAANEAAGRFPPDVLAEVLADRWQLACQAAARAIGLPALRRYLRAPLARHARLNAHRWYVFLRSAALGTLGLRPRQRS